MTINSPAAPIPSPAIGANLTASDLQGYLGQSVLDFCGKYGDIGDDKLEDHTRRKNHCEHFVSHVLQLRIPGAALCSNVSDTKYTNKDQMLGYCIRVNEVFNILDGRAFVDAHSPPDSSCLIVATVRHNIKSQEDVTIGDNHLKHIGIFINGKVYNYSNPNSEVRETPLNHFRKHYGAHTVLLRADFP
jgi:hypothetical protein